MIFCSVSFAVLLFYFSMPGSDYPLFVWVVCCPILLSLKSKSPFQASLIFFTFMTLSMLIAVWWLMPAIMEFTRSGALISLPLLILFCAVHALPYALAAFITIKLKWLSQTGGAWLFSACMVLLVTCWPSLMPGNFAHSLYEFPTLIQLASLGGVPMLLFTVFLVNALFANVILSLVNRDYRKASTYSFQIIGISFFVIGFGAFTLYSGDEEKGKADHQSMAIGYVQPKLYRDDNLYSLFRLSKDLLEKHPDIDLFVWPEFPTPFSYENNLNDRARIEALLKRFPVDMLFVSGYVYAEGEKHEDPLSRYYNSAQLLNYDGELQATYAKQVLVPFFEYLPYEDYFPLMRESFPEALRYVAGTESKTFKLNEEITIAPLICYETIFSGLTRSFMDQGPNLIINLTNDIWLGKTNASNYHLALGLFRAVEFGVPWVRITNSGISAAVLPSGEIVRDSLTPNMSASSGVMSVSILPHDENHRTVYAMLGNWFLYVLLLLLILHEVRNRRGAPPRVP